MSSESPIPARDAATGRFVAGRSGNPRGRPRRGGAVERAILKALAAPVTVEDEDGRPRRVSKLAAAARQVADKGVAGDARDGRLALDLALKAEQRTHAVPDPHPESRSTRRLAAEDAAILERLVERVRAMALAPPNPEHEP